jgi:hypothetical protein
MNGWDTKLSELSVWQACLLGAYLIYFVIRVIRIWGAMDGEGIIAGYKKLFINGRTFRLYHLFRMILDLPPAFVGLIFPLLNKVLTLKIYEFKEEKKKFRRKNDDDQH